MNKRINSHRFGLFAEKIAKIFLSLKLYKIIHNRYRNNFGEIDIIASKNKTLVFIEVKARSSYIGDNELVTKKQIKRITKSASIFICNNKIYDKYDIRFDLLIMRPWFMPIHIKSAWYDEFYYKN